MMKRIAILGSTGSIGSTAIRVAQELGIQIDGLAAGGQVDRFIQQIQALQPRYVALRDPEGAKRIQELFPSIDVSVGEEGLCQLATLPEIDGIVMGIAGLDALKPTLAAIHAKKSIAFASKEILAAAGSLIMHAVRESAVPFLPVDSEHAALFQCLQGSARSEVRKVWITASGGPFLHANRAELEAVTVEQALNHPTWRMGKKISVDSSTLMNKGLELIEAHYLFGFAPSELDVIIHPQSTIHAVMEWKDRQSLAHLHPPDMAYPIQYALAYPERVPISLSGMDWSVPIQFSFFPPDEERFPALRLARSCLHEGKSSSCYLNAANEILVHRFLRGEITWIQIIQKLETLMNQYQTTSLHSLDDVMAVDQQARREALTL